MFTDYTFGNVLHYLENKEILRLFTVSKGWHTLAAEYLKNWRVIVCEENQKVAIRMSDLGYKINLDLHGADITDVSMLGNVHTLYLCNTKVADVSMLGNVHIIWHL